MGTVEPAPLVAWEFVRDGEGGDLGDVFKTLLTTEHGESLGGGLVPGLTLVGIDGPIDPRDASWGTAALDLVLGDFTADAAVDELDLDLWLAHAFVPPGQPGFEPQFDLNGDGPVNQFDLALLIPRLAPAGEPGKETGEAAGVKPLLTLGASLGESPSPQPSPARGEGDYLAALIWALALDTAQSKARARHSAAAALPAAPQDSLALIRSR